jgi:hypothetical protein
MKSAFLLLLVGAFIGSVTVTAFSNVGIMTSMTKSRRPIMQQRQNLNSRLNGKIFGTVEWSDLVYDNTSIAFDAWEWTNGMGAPAALVAAAVLVTLSETREDTAPRKSDRPLTRILKRLMRFFLLTSFALEVISIFVGSMTGNLLLGHGPQQVAKKMIGYQAPLALLRHHHE